MYSDSNEALRTQREAQGYPVQDRQPNQSLEHSAQNNPYDPPQQLPSTTRATRLLCRDEETSGKIRVSPRDICAGVFEPYLSADDIPLATYKTPGVANVVQESAQRDDRTSSEQNTGQEYHTLNTLHSKTSKPMSPTDTKSSGGKKSESSAGKKKRPLQVPDSSNAARSGSSCSHDSKRSRKSGGQLSVSSTHSTPPRLLPQARPVISYRPAPANPERFPAGARQTAEISSASSEEYHSSDGAPVFLSSSDVSAHVNPTALQGSSATSAAIPAGTGIPFQGHAAELSHPASLSHHVERAESHERPFGTPKKPKTSRCRPTQRVPQERLKATRAARRERAKARTAPLLKAKEEEEARRRAVEIESMEDEERRAVLAKMEEERRRREEATKKEMKRVKNRESVEKSRAKEQIMEAEAETEAGTLDWENDRMDLFLQWAKKSNLLKNARREAQAVVPGLGKRKKAPR